MRKRAKEFPIHLRILELKHCIDEQTQSVTKSKGVKIFLKLGIFSLTQKMRKRQNRCFKTLH